MNITIEYKRFYGTSNESAKLLAYLSVFIHIIKHKSMNRSDLNAR